MAFGSYLDHLKDFSEVKDINDFTISAIVLKKIDALYNYKQNDKSIKFAKELHQTLMKCYRHAYLNGNRSFTSIWSSK